MKAYQNLLKRVGIPIGIVGAVILSSWAAGALFNLSPNEDAWNAQCEQLSVGSNIITDDEKMGNQHFCVMLTPMEDHPVRTTKATWKARCWALGGVYKARNNIYTCYMETVIKELGARETYGGTP